MCLIFSLFLFFNDSASPESYTYVHTLSLHDALPICAGQRAFGENYVQEAASNQDALRELTIEWHLIGHLQSNKARDAAQRFDWVQSIDRPSVIAALARHRSDAPTPLKVLIQEIGRAAGRERECQYE